MNLEPFCPLWRSRLQSTFGANAPSSLQLARKSERLHESFPSRDRNWGRCVPSFRHNLPAQKTAARTVLVAKNSVQLFLRSIHPIYFALGIPSPAPVCPLRTRKPCDGGSGT